MDIASSILEVDLRAHGPANPSILFLGKAGEERGQILVFVLVAMAKETEIRLPSGVDQLVIPAALMDQSKYPCLSYSAMMLYAVLCALPKEISETGEEYLEISSMDIRSILGCKDTAFRTNLKALRSAGLVESYKPRFASVLRYIVKEAA